MSVNPITICISYHQRLIADGIYSILSRNKMMTVGKVVPNNPKVLLEEVSNHKPDVLIMEAEYISPHFIDFIENIRQSFPQLKLLVVSGLVSHEALNELMLVIDGYFLRTSESEKLLFAVQEVTNSQKYLCPQLINILVNKTNTENILNHALTSREKEILLLWFNLGSIFQIAEKLHISKTTVHTHLKNIRDKLGKPSSAKLIFYACQENQANGNLKPVCPYCRSICTIQTHKASTIQD